MSLVARLRRALAAFNGKRMLSSVSDRGWLTLFRGVGDWQPGAWQQDSEMTHEETVGFSPIYSCITLVASDVGKICLDLMTEKQGIWVKTETPQFSPLLRKPNHYQTRQQFIETWVISKLRRGNTYVLKVRDASSRVKALYVLDPDRVTPLVAPDGQVYYELLRDDLSKRPQDRYPAAPASEIIHDRMECLFHPLVGITPLFAAALSSSQGLRIQRNSEVFFRNMSRPGGMLTAPDEIDDETAGRLKTDFEANFSNEKIGRLMVAGSGLEYKPFAHTAHDSQLVEQLKLSAEAVCMAFHVPAYMIGAGPAPSYNNVEALNQQYYTQCLQKLFNAIEDLLDDGLGLHALGYRTEFDLEDLLRMDSTARMKFVVDGVGGGVLATNEGRAKFGLLPVKGGDVPFLQEQNWPISILAERKTPEREPTPPADAAPPDAEEMAKFWRDVADLPVYASEYAKALPLLEAR